jgi:Rrf2 family protein
MKLSRASSYALHALVTLAGRDPAQPFASHHLAEADGAPERFLLKVLKPLVTVRVLRSNKGPHGGYTLARPPAEITLLEIVEAVDGPIRAEAPQFDGRDTGPLNKRLQAACDQLAGLTRQTLKEVRLSDLVGSVGGGKAKGKGRKKSN